MSASSLWVTCGIITQLRASTGPPPSPAAGGSPTAGADGAGSDGTRTDAGGSDASGAGVDSDSDAAAFDSASAALPIVSGAAASVGAPSDVAAAALLPVESSA